MGEVYRANDSDLGRPVAIKVLPEGVAHDAERVARFEREAKTLAALNHPNIAQIYGLERSGGVTALVMELVEGPTLADRIALGALPVDEALPVAKQIAEALQAAHEQGIIHRDLKPANAKVRPDGTVKVLDFGLAKAIEPQAAMSSSLSLSPTITTPAMTEAGVVLGTAAYMSPEQAKGRTADKRSDLWAFGCVLYEMLTGRRAFGGEDVAETLAAVIRGEPDWSLVPPDVPHAILVVMRRCLEKDRARRLRDAGSALAVAEDPLLATRGATNAIEQVSRGTFWRRIATVAGVFLLAAVAGLSGWMMRPDRTRVSRLGIAPGAGEGVVITGQGRDVAISPDGTRVVYVGPNGSLLLRPLDQLETTVLVRGGSGAAAPFFFADGQWVGYAVGNAGIRKVSATGGPTTRVAGGDGGFSAGATSAEDGTLVYATTNLVSGLYIVRPGSTEHEVLTTPDRQAGEEDHYWPQFLPGGRALLFTVTAIGAGTGLGARVAVLDLATRQYKVVVPSGSDAHYTRSGHLVYVTDGVLRGVPFDLGRLETRGASVPVVTNVLQTPRAAGDFDVAADGTLVYIPAGVATGVQRGVERELLWIWRDGRIESLDAPVRAYLYPRLSPDGSKVLLDIRDQDNDIWMWDLRRQTLTNVTANPALDRFPVWAPDGKRFVFTSDRAGGMSAIYRWATDGSGEVERLVDPTPQQQTANALTPDGKQLIFDRSGQLFAVTLDGTRRVTQLVQSDTATRAALSPDGRWLAYHGKDSGRFEVYMRPFPTTKDGREQVSNAGGVEAWWSRTGSELFYFDLEGALMSVQVGRGTTSVPRAVFNAPALRSAFVFNPTGTAAATFDISADGERFLMVRPIAGANPTSSAASIVVVQNWFDELKRLVP